ncbi:MAG: heme exporter protein CcmD [Acidimicrobiia bacterium]
MSLAMTHASYVVAGWAVPVLAFGAYALRVLRRGRALSRQVPREQRRWS